MSKGKYEFEYIMNTILWVYLTLLLPRMECSKRRIPGDEEKDDDVFVVLLVGNGVVAKYIINNIFTDGVLVLYGIVLFFQVVFSHKLMKCCYVLCRAHTQEIIAGNLWQALCTHLLNRIYPLVDFLIESIFFSRKHQLY